ncbi:protein translocase subunit SecD [Paenibacillus bovis]|uniref:Protein translocase subunit SecD n=1 Tax=Paenibacillus bovis TaxID=1616788 RepID=A0A172ZLA9_9BACL|nr:protein translocase subunit SecD [Paenibacillus bovis]ANF98037.1 protein-export membrane protein SecD [Paenibacillus bovis]
MNRIISFVVVILVVAGIIGTTTPLFKDVRLGLDLKGGFEILYQATPTTQGEAVTRESLTQTARSLEQRANALGTSEPEITTEGTDRIRLRIAGVTDEATVRKTMKEPAELTFRSMDGCSTDASKQSGIPSAEKQGQDTSKSKAADKTSSTDSKSSDSNAVSAQTEGLPQGVTVTPDTGAAGTTATENTYANEDPAKLYCKIELTGDDFKENGASVVYNSLQQPEITIEVKDAKKFGEITKRLINQPLGIFLNGQLLSAPTVRAELTDGKASISGSYTVQEAQQLKDQINLGALPLKLNEIYSQSVGASLGQQSLNETLKAGVVASIIILIFMILVYRIPGLIAGFSIITYVWLTVMIFVAGDFTLTLPGIAAFILGVGMAVDSNIITYERIKDEIRNGKSISSAFKAGSRSSFGTIMDAQLTTIIAAAVMFALGTGAVRGFALVLIFNILVSIVTNVFFSRFLLSLLVKGRLVNKPEYFGVKESERDAL